ncbi:MAG: TIGR00266 family protein [Myxococcota bacterium]
MQHEITHQPAFSMLRVDLEPNEVLVTEPGAMVAMSRSVEIEAKMNAARNPGCMAMVFSMFAAFIRKLLGGESFFVSHYTTPQPGSVWIAPTLAGDMVHRTMNGDKITLSSGAYVASAGDIEVNVKYGGLSGLLAKEGLFFLEISGTGDVWFNSFGSVEPIQVNGTYVVDNGHIVGFDGDLDFNIKSAGGGLMGFFASGEGAVCEFTGNGTVWMQTRNTDSIVSWLTPILPS